MEFSRRILCIIALAFACLGAAVAAPPEQAENMTLKKCLDEGLKRNINILNAEFDKQAAAARVGEARSAGLPHIEASIQSLDYLKKNVMLLPGELMGAPGSNIALEIGTQYNTIASLKISQLLYSQTYFLALEASKKYSQLSEIKVEKVKNDFIYDLTKMYLLASVTNRQIDLIKKNIARIDTIIDITKIALENGYAKSVDLDRAVVNKSDLAVQLESSEALFEQQLDIIRYQIGYSRDITVSEFVESLLGKSGAAMDSSDVFGRKEIALLTLQSDLMNDNIKSIKYEYIPTLSLIGQAQYQNLREDYKQFGVKWYPNVYVGFNISIPVFDGLNKSARIEQAEVELLKSEAALTDTKNYFKTDFEQSMRDYDKNRSALDRRKQNVELAEKIMDVSRVKFTEGSFSMSDLLTDEISLCNAELNYLGAQLQVLTSELNLLKSTGKLEILLTK